MSKDQLECLVIWAILAADGDLSRIEVTTAPPGELVSLTIHNGPAAEASR